MEARPIVPISAQGPPSKAVGLRRVQPLEVSQPRIFEPPRDTRRHAREIATSPVFSLKPPEIRGLTLAPVNPEAIKVAEQQNLLRIRREIEAIAVGETNSRSGAIRDAVATEVADTLLPFVPVVGPLNEIGRLVTEEVVLTSMEKPNIDPKALANHAAMTVMVHVALKVATFLVSIGL